jgi:hypothetical protein
VNDPLDGVRPGARRAFWLREALAAEPPSLAADVAAPPLAGRIRADVAILGGGYTGLWTALRIRELEPAARVVVIEQDLCGAGPAGRNGGFVTGWWDELPGLIARFGETEAVRTARALDDAISSLGPWCESHDVDAEWHPDGFLQVSAAPAQDDAWLEATEACARLGFGERWRSLAEAEVAGVPGRRLDGPRRHGPARQTRPRPSPGRAGPGDRDPRADGRDASA